MGPIRGIVLILFGLLALYRGWTLRTGEHALLAYAFGAVALALGAWRVLREPKRPLP